MCDDCKLDAELNNGTLRVVPNYSLHDFITAEYPTSTFRITDPVVKQSNLYLSHLWVDPHYTHLGIADTLLKQATTTATIVWLIAARDPQKFGGEHFWRQSSCNHKSSRLSNHADHV